MSAVRKGSLARESQNCLLMTVARNIFADIPAQAPEEVFTILQAADRVRIERIVSYGHASPPGFWYDQPHHEWVTVLRGRARLCIEGEYVELEPGGYVNIPARAKHRVEWTSPDEPTIWLAVHYGNEL